jgi:hypothetical protein
LLGIMVMSLASLAWAGVPDLTLSSAEIDPAADGASVFIIPNGQGAAFDEAVLPDGSIVDATITLTLVDGDANPIFGYPFEDMWIETTGGSFAPCAGNATADASTDEMGMTEWQLPLTAGGSSFNENVLVYVAGTALTGSGINLTFNSPDMNGDLNINLSDIGLFTPMIGSDTYEGDFNYDGTVNLSDIGLFTPAIGTSCP